MNKAPSWRVSPIRHLSEYILPFSSLQPILPRCFYEGYKYHLLLPSEREGYSSSGFAPAPPNIDTRQVRRLFAGTGNKPPPLPGRPERRTCSLPCRRWKIVSARICLQRQRWPPRLAKRRCKPIPVDYAARTTFLKPLSAIPVSKWRLYAYLHHR